MEVEENRIAQAEELEVLKSIYGNDDCRVSSTNQFCEVQVFPADGNTDGELFLRLGVHFPESYPSTYCPVAELHAPWLSGNSRQRVVEMFTNLYEESVGEVVVFRWVEWLKEQDWLWEEARSWMREHAPPPVEHAGFADQKAASTASNDSHMPEEVLLDTSLQSSERTLDDKGLEELDKILGIVHGEPFTEKRSTFQAHLAPAKIADDVEAVMDALLRNRKIAAATHNIMAYRISMPVLQDHDDDGETAAGGRLLHLLQIVDALDVVVVVSRWYGGIQLGPDRFKHINNAARSLLGSWGYIAGVNSSASANHKTLPKSNLQKGRKR